MGSTRWSGLEVFATCPPSSDSPPDGYLRRVEEVARWSDEAGCDGILVYTDNRLLDPWLVAQAVVAVTSRLMPLVAVQPVYVHPYAVAKLVTTFAHLYGRRLCLNMVAGGFRNDLVSLGDGTAHDSRYDRLGEFTEIVRALTDGRSAVTYEGRYFSVTNLKLTPPVPAEFRPAIFMSGSSPAGLATAARVGATAIKYPQRADGEQSVRKLGGRFGIRVGIVARRTAMEAWRVALERFPVDRKGQIAHQLAMKVTDSHWHRALTDLGSQSDGQPHPYWLGPFENYKTFCPYLVGSYEDVAGELARYLRLGFDSLILDVPASSKELAHTQTAIASAVELRAPTSEDHA